MTEAKMGLKVERPTIVPVASKTEAVSTLRHVATSNLTNRTAITNKQVIPQLVKLQAHAATCTLPGCMPCKIWGALQRQKSGGSFGGGLEEGGEQEMLGLGNVQKSLDNMRGVEDARIAETKMDIELDEALADGVILSQSAKDKRDRQ